MKEWIFNIGTTVLLVSVITILLPDGKTGKFIKSIFSILILFVAIKPMATFSKIQLDNNIVYSEEIDIEIQKDYIKFTFEKKKAEYEQNCYKILENLGVSNAKIEIFYSDTDLVFNIENVKIDLSNSVIISDKEHIFIIEEIKEKITSYLCINDSILVINE